MAHKKCPMLYMAKLTISGFRYGSLMRDNGIAYLQFFKIFTERMFNLLPAVLRVLVKCR